MQCVEGNDPQISALEFTDYGPVSTYVYEKK
jgi:hypothetical protein